MAIFFMINDKFNKNNKFVKLKLLDIYKQV